MTFDKIFDLTAGWSECIIFFNKLVDIKHKTAHGGGGVRASHFLYRIGFASHIFPRIFPRTTLALPPSCNSERWVIHFFFYFFSGPIYFLALLSCFLSVVVTNSGNADPGLHSGSSSPITTSIRAFCFLARTLYSASSLLLVASRRILPTHFLSS